MNRDRYLRLQAQSLIGPSILMLCVFFLSAIRTVIATPDVNDLGASERAGTAEKLLATSGPGETITIILPGDVPLELVRIPAGSFQMGRYPGEQDRYPSEDPQHTVNIAYDFYLGKYEVTQTQWEAVMETTPWSGGTFVQYAPDSPAVYVSWHDAQSFVSALNTHITDTGQGPATLRLPSEAEWEYACRAGTTTRFYWGDDLSETEIDDYAWYHGNAYSVGDRYAHVVGQKLPNAWGLYDMSGNVWEWCEDDGHSSYTGAPTDGSAWGDGSASTRVARGGAWFVFAESCRSARRSYQNDPSTAGNGGGFRVAGSSQGTPTPTPVPPIVSAIGDDSAVEGGSYTGPVPSLPQGTPPIVWSILSGPGGLRVDSTTGQVRWPVATLAGSPHLIRIQASNESGSDDESWSVAVTPNNTPGPFIPGDLYQDGVLDRLDIQAAVDYLLKKAQIPEAFKGRADANVDGVIDIADLVKISNWELTPTPTPSELTITLPKRTHNHPPRRRDAGSGADSGRYVHDGLARYRSQPESR